MVNQTISFMLHYPFHLIIGGLIAAIVFGIIAMIIAAIGKEKSSLVVAGAYLFYGLMYVSGGVIALTIFTNISIAFIVVVSRIFQSLQS